MVRQLGSGRAGKQFVIRKWVGVELLYPELAMWTVDWISGGSSKLELLARLWLVSQESRVMVVKVREGKELGHNITEEVSGVAPT